MKSIRRSLILNVFILLAITLGAVFWVVYRSTYETLEDKKRAVRDLIELQFGDQRDEAMRQQALTLASLVHSHFSFQRPPELQYAHLGLITVAASPYAHAQMPLWLLEGGTQGDSLRLQGIIGTKIEPNEDVLDTEFDLGPHEFLQINSQWGNAWQYPRAGSELPVDRKELMTNITLTERFDFLTLPSQTRVRRVVIKAPLTRWRTLWAQPPAQPGPGPRSYDPPATSRALLASTLLYRVEGSQRPPRKGPQPGVVTVLGSTSTVDSDQHKGTLRETALPSILVQVAWNLDSGHPKLVELEKKRADQLEAVERETDMSLSDMKRRFIGIGAVALSILIIGGWVVIGVGLKPLQRVSSAVSRISPRDFQLPIDTGVLPREISPVAERLRETLLELKKAFEREKRAAADISHELRTPLAAITTTLEVALRKARSNEEYRATLDDCREIARQMSLLVERLLMLAYVDAGADQLHFQDVEVGTIVRECSAIGKPLAEAHGLNFRIRVADSIPVQTDPDKLREVLMNLVHNAIEYNRPGGDVEVVASAGKTGGVVLEVTDTGIGMPPEIHDKIFERFFRNDPSRNAAGAHAGLGLAIVKEYIDRLGGRLSLQSSVGQGSRFRVELPPTQTAA